MGRGSHQGGTTKGKRYPLENRFVEGQPQPIGSGTRFTSASERKADRRAKGQTGRPGHIRREKQPNPRATTRPGRRKN